MAYKIVEPIYKEVKLNLGSKSKTDISRGLHQIKKVHKRYVVMSKNTSDVSLLNEITEELEKELKKFSE